MMRDFFIEMFSDFSRIIVFLHVTSAALLIGSLFVMRFIIQPVEVDVPDIKIKFTSCMKMLKRYMIVTAPLMGIIIVTSLFMHLGLGFKSGNPTTYVMVHTKEALWTFITFNFIYMYLKYVKAKKGFDEENYIEVEENVILMVRYLIPLNLVLAIISVYFGVVLRGY
jgi:uncharacterized membrane protein